MPFITDTFIRASLATQLDSALGSRTSMRLYHASADWLYPTLLTQLWGHIYNQLNDEKKARR